MLKLDLPAYKTLSSFPKDESLRSTWIKVCKTEEKFKKVKDAVICSQHFQITDYLQGSINKQKKNLENCRNMH
jgi:hypothetical protein